MTSPGEPDVVTSSRLAAIRNPGPAGAAAARHRSAHELKGASGTTGAVRRERRCRELETTAKSGTVDSCRDVVDTLDAEYARAERAIAELVR